MRRIASAAAPVLSEKPNFWSSTPVATAGGVCASTPGTELLPMPVLMTSVSPYMGSVAARIGPRVFLVAGPALAGVGLLLTCSYAHDFDFATHLLPGRLVLAAGLALTIAPLSAIILISVEPEHCGIAAAFQNAVGRTSALTAVACVGLVAAGPLNEASFARLLQVAAALFFLGAVVSGFVIANPAHSIDHSRDVAAADAVETVPA